MRRTKIVCTIGPASDKPEVLRQMMEEGMNVARLNFSHGTLEQQAKRIETIRRVAFEAKKPIGLLMDTKGPQIRTGMVKDGSITLEAGARITLTSEVVEGTRERVHVNYRELPQDVSPGNMVLIADGMITLKVIEAKGTEILCEVVDGGELGSQKNVHVPGIKINLPAVTGDDIRDINFGIEQEFDFIAASFIRKAYDVLEIRRILEEKGSSMHIIAKIETQEGVSNIDEILKVSDGIMVARGDLGVDIPTEEVPLAQKMIIEKCNQAGKPVITATQMLESMIQNPRPTRAEATDVANAIFDGSDAVMLSGETAAGNYPVDSVSTMARIAERTEKALHYEEILGKKAMAPMRTVTDAISHATCTTALDLGAGAIVTATQSGHTARMVSKYRPKAPIIAVTPHVEVVRRLTLVWGVKPLLVGKMRSTDEMFGEAVNVALAAGFIKCGDLTVITAGVPAGIAGTTNLLKVHIVGDVLARGTGIGAQAVTGRTRIVRTAKEAGKKVTEGDILITAATDRDFVPAMEKAAAVITEAGGLTSHAAIVGLNLGIPVVVGVEGITSLLEDGQLITIDGMRGLIYRGATKVL